MAAGLAVGGACERVDRSGPVGPSQAALEITIVPDPLRILWVCPAGDVNCYGSLDPTVTIAETAGIGGVLDSVEFIARDPVLGVPLTTLRLTAADLQARAGTNRLPPMGRFAVRPIIEGYPVPSRLPRPTLEAEVVVQMTDDRGNAIRQTKRVPVS